MIAVSVATPIVFAYQRTYGTSFCAPATSTEPERIVRKLSSVTERGIRDAPPSVPSVLNADEMMYATGKSAKTTAISPTACRHQFWSSDGFFRRRVAVRPEAVVRDSAWSTVVIAGSPVIGNART